LTRKLSVSLCVFFVRRFSNYRRNEESYADRSRIPSDPDFVKLSVKELLTPLISKNRMSDFIR
jgi:hypothetical protein